MTYDADWMRDNRATLQAEDWQALDDFLACHAAQVRITEDDAADLARLVGHPDLIHRREHMTCAPHWTTTNAPSPAWMSHRAPRFSTRTLRFGAYAPLPPTSALGSSCGPRAASRTRSGARWLASGMTPLLLFAGLAYAVRLMGGT